ncbi:MAG: restriction endonuclease subunit S [Planctomycetes bacterium]|nr:restriction endonuclease subunit S [Planctomycetota bacterium]
MKPDTFFNMFAELADTPNAVPRMRRLILDLAVQGKLVVQEPKDEPAEELLKRIQAEKARLVKLGEIKKQEQLPAVAEDAISFSLPAGWAASQLGDVAVCLDYMREPINGTERDLRIAGKVEAELYPYYGATQQQGWIDDYIFDTELVLLGEDGVPFFDDLRPKAYLISGKTWVNNHAHVFRGILVSNSFVMHWLNSFDYTGRVAGSTRSKLNQAKAVDIPIPLPPLAEQKRIVAKVDELMGLCDRLEAQQAERESRHAALSRAALARFADAPTPSNLTFLFHKSYTIAPADLRKSILTLAVQGGLSPGSSDPAEWSTVTMEEVCDLITDGEHATPQRIPSGVPLATAKNVRDGFLDMAHTDYVAPETAEKCWKRCKPKHGDILMVCVGATTGRVCLVKNPPDMVLVRSVALLRPSTKRIEGTFLDLFLRSPSGQMQIWGGVRQNAQPCLYLGKMSAFTIQLPPLAEQRRIVAKVKQLMAWVDALEAQLAASRASGEKLLEAIVGELVTH